MFPNDKHSNHIFLPRPRYDPRTLTPPQLLAAASAGDWEIEPIPRVVTLTGPARLLAMLAAAGGIAYNGAASQCPPESCPVSLSITPVRIDWTSTGLPIEVRLTAASAAAARAWPLYPLIFELQWTALTPGPRKKVAELSREHPDEVAALLREIAAARMTLPEFVRRLREGFPHWR